MSTYEVCYDLIDERVRQDEKWGEQNHPDGTGPLKFSLNYRVLIRPEDRVRYQCDKKHRAGVGTWADILLEEVFEAMAEDDPAKLREELIQVAAVAVSWVEAIDRRNQSEEVA